MMNNARQHIDLIDKELMQLFEQRMNLVSDIVQYKKTKGLSIQDAEREAHIITQICSCLTNKCYEPYAVQFFKSLLHISRQYQQDHIQDK